MAAALTASIANDGQTPILANLPMSGFRHTGVSNGVARTDYAAVGQLQDGGLNWIAAAGTADALTATYVPAITALTNGLLLGVRATAANATTTPTFAPNGLTAHTITKNGGAALAAGDLENLGEYWLRYNLANTRWELLNPAVVTGTSANNIVRLNGSSQLPAVDGSLLTNIVGGLTKIGTQTANNSATNLAFTGISSSYAQLLLLIRGLRPATTDSILVQIGTGATPTWQTSGYVSGGVYEVANVGTPTGYAGGTSASGLVLDAGNTVSATTEGLCCTISIHNLQAGTCPTKFTGAFSTDITPGGTIFGDARNSSAVTAIRVITSSGGNLKDGAITLLGFAS